MNLKETENKIKNHLLSIYEEREAANIACILIEEVCCLSRTARILNPNKECTDIEKNKINDYLKRLLSHEPLQYILNKAWFYKMELYVNRDVLIPRPETEELVDWVIADLNKKYLGLQGNLYKSDKTDILKIIDVGTGSGCIALALKKNLQLAEVWGCDFSEKALNVARRNGSDLDIRVDFQGLDFLDRKQQKQLPSVDIIVSNPPYIPLVEKNQLNKNVTDYEPHLALFVPENDPLIFYKAIADYAQERLHENGLIYLEVHELLAKEVILLFEKYNYKNYIIKNDMQGKERMVRIQCSN